MVYPHPQIYHHLGAIFVHVPKTGGTAIERALREFPGQVVGGHTTALGYQRYFSDEFQRYFTFSMVRHPATRFVSAWRYLREHPVHPALNNAPIHECDRFSTWLDRVRCAPGLLDRIVHFHPQHRFVCDAMGEVILDRIYRYEEFANAWTDLCGRFALPHAPLRSVNASHAIGEPEYPDGYLEWIAGSYAEDFRLGGYEIVPAERAMHGPPKSLLDHSLETSDAPVPP